MLQWIVGRCCNGWGGVATNGRGGTGKMQQGVAIFHSRWTTVNNATAMYGSYRGRCNRPTRSSYNRAMKLQQVDSK